MKLLTIIGQMRSGTSAVAEVVHTLGIPVAIHSPAPLPPTYRWDWEDSELSTILAKGRFSKGWMVDYFRDREVHSQLFPTDWVAIKSPLLAIHWEELMEAVEETDVEDTHTLRVWRSPHSVDASMALQPHLSKETNEAIKDHLCQVCEVDSAIHYETLVSEPRMTVRGLARRLGVKDEQRILDATSRVQRPTSKEDTTWLPSQLP